MNKPEIIIPEQPKIKITIESKSKLNPEIQKEKDELNEMKKICHETSLSLGKLINLKKKGYRIIKID